MNWDSRNPCVQQIQEFHGSNIHRYFCSPKNLSLLLLRKRFFCLYKCKEPSKIQLIYYFQVQKIIYMNFFIVNPLILPLPKNQIHVNFSVTRKYRKIFNQFHLPTSCTFVSIILQEISILSKDKLLSHYIKYFLQFHYFQRLSKPVANRGLCHVSKEIYQENVVLSRSSLPHFFKLKTKQTLTSVHQVRVYKYLNMYG